MIRMLVVDDEIYALKGITQGIDWRDLPICEILEAEDVGQAMRLLESNPIDLILSDIEMPGMNGLELLRWVKRHRPQALTVFLTGHARFDYAQEALHYGCFDYILKPVDHDLLKEIVARAIEEIHMRDERRKIEETLEANRKQWASRLPILVERFWQDALAGRLDMSGERLNRILEDYGLPLTSESRILPVLLSIEQWEIELDSRDESIMEYALRKAAAETLLGERPGTVLQDRNEINMALLYVPEGEAVDRSILLKRCTEYVRACMDYFHCRISCYVAEPAKICELHSSLARLQAMERANVSMPQTVQDSASVDPSPASPTGILLPSFLDWGMLLENGSHEELAARIDETLRDWRAEAAGREALELFRYGILHMLYQAVYRKGCSIYDIFQPHELSDPQALRSAQQLAAWAIRMISKTGQTLSERQRDGSAVIAKVQSYIIENLQLDLTRDSIAGSVYRNPAYLSRLFRKETGSSLSDYIAMQRIERAKKYLIDTNDKVSHIAEKVGYVHFSYFAKLFKKVTSLSPQEYRKKHQTMH